MGFDAEGFIDGLRAKGGMLQAWFTVENSTAQLFMSADPDIFKKALPVVEKHKEEIAFVLMHRQGIDHFETVQ